MEACSSANPWGHQILKLVHIVKCIPVATVKLFLIGNKNDANDALRPTIRFVAIKQVEKQDSVLVEQLIFSLLIQKKQSIRR